MKADSWEIDELVSTPANPVSGRRLFYAKSDGVYERDSGGVETGPLVDQNHTHAAGDITSGTMAVARLPVMVGASDVASGTAGIVPQPVAGEDDEFLSGDGTFRKVKLNSEVLETLPVVNGGIGLTSYTVGQMIYASASTTLSPVSQNATTTRKFLMQDGNGTTANAPAWQVLASGDIPNLSTSKITSGFPWLVSEGGTGLTITQANKAFIGPTSGADAAPTWRLLVSADIPNLDASKITTGQLALARGGTNADLSSVTTNSLFYMGSSGFTSLTAAEGFLRSTGAAPGWHQISGWSEPTCFTADRAFTNVTTTDLAQTKNVLATLISDLRASKLFT